MLLVVPLMPVWASPARRLAARIRALGRATGVKALVVCDARTCWRLAWDVLAALAEVLDGVALAAPLDKPQVSEPARTRTLLEAAEAEARWRVGKEGFALWTPGWFPLSPRWPEMLRGGKIPAGPEGRTPLWFSANGGVKRGGADATGWAWVADEAALAERLGGRRAGRLWPMGRPVAFNQVGRFGDLLLLLPAMREIWIRTGRKPWMVVQPQFSTVLDGVSYVEPVLTDESDLFARQTTRALRQLGLDVVDVMQSVNVAGVFSYMEAKYWVMDLLEDIWSLPLILDRRSPEREAELAEKVLPSGPVVLYNFTGNTSPFPYAKRYEAAIAKVARGRASVVNLGGVRAYRIYDLLGLYDRAEVLITGDTSTLHLAGASPVRCMAFVQDGGGGSLLRCRTWWSCRYSQAPYCLPEFEERLDEALRLSETR